MEYLTKKDWAKIVYSLYEKIYNAYDIVKIPFEMEEKRIKKFAGLNLSKEEIWAYEKNVVFLPDEPYLARIDKIREEEVHKREFLLSVAIPAYRICVSPEKMIYNPDLDKFTLENEFFKGVFEGEQEKEEWFWLDAENIKIEDAEKIGKNIESFFASRNC